MTKEVNNNIQETYQEMKKRQQEELKKIPIKYAFSDEQLKKGMKELGLNENDTDKIVAIGAGGFMKKTDVEAYKEMQKKHNKEFWTEIAKDKVGDKFIKNMFLYELNNHEYSYTNDITDTLMSLGLSNKDIEENKNLRTGLILAEKEILEAEESEEEEI